MNYFSITQGNNLLRLATGFRAPSIQGRIMFCPDFQGGTDPATNCVSVADTEKILSFEAGIKTILAQNRVRFNLTGYVFEMDDQQVSAVGGEFNTATLLNVAKTEGYGLQTAIQWIRESSLDNTEICHLAPDRPLYRPGDLIHFRTVWRWRKDAMLDQGGDDA